MKQMLKKLVQADSTAENGELAAAEVICEELAKSKINSKIETWDGKRANLTARIKSDEGKKVLLFACHLDVVGPGRADWQYGPFAGVENNSRIYGRGSVDMKGPISAIVTAIRQITEAKVKLRGDIILTALAGEETDSCGAGRFITKLGGQLPDLVGVVITEPTDFQVVTAHRGLIWLKVTTIGKAAHGSTPRLGINAITSMKSVLDELDGYKISHEPHKLLGECSMSINTIAGGQEINVVADRCSMGIDIRTLPGQSHQAIVADFEKLLSRLKKKDSRFSAQLQVVRDLEALETDCNCDFVKQFCATVGAEQTKAVGFTTDGPFFASLGAPVVVFGPGESQLCHKPDEYIEIADLEKAVEHYKNIILKFLS